MKSKAAIEAIQKVCRVENHPFAIIMNHASILPGYEYFPLFWFMKEPVWIPGLLYLQWQEKPVELVASKSLWKLDTWCEEYVRKGDSFKRKKNMDGVSTMAEQTPSNLQSC